ncbi:unnamed protein product [Meloidogyne enterolobii]|uniref:Uncharacterized protein n=1 Tax=Meloidogyne enterolobii TaxID=390850 RepID=A0ACB0ZK61_MELEN
MPLEGMKKQSICSAHFFGGEKHEGDIPIDTPKFIELPPKESRTAERKSRLKGRKLIFYC